MNKATFLFLTPLLLAPLAALHAQEPAAPEKAGDIKHYQYKYKMQFIKTRCIHYKRGY